MADVIESVNKAIDAIKAIQKELGLNPKSIYGNLRARIDILENRINNPNSPSPSVDNPFTIGSSAQTISAGTGEPTSSEISGSIYLRSDGEDYENIYFRKNSLWNNISNLYTSYRLYGEEASGAAIDLRLNDGSKISLSDGFTYAVTIKTIIKSTSGTIHRAYFENVVLMDKTSNILTINSDTQPVQITNGTSYSITVSSVANELTILVDAEGSDDRKASCIVEIQKLDN